LKKTPPTSDAREAQSRYAYEGLDRVIHERARLSVMTSLAAHPKGLTFNELKAFCALTDGNLSRHLQVLLESKLVGMTKLAGSGRRETRCRLTALGSRKYLEYLAVLEQLLQDASERQKVATAGKEPSMKSHG
jgi:DNA-binding MarR family transcriptional regulator